MKKLMILAMVSLFSLFTAAAASACDGMKGHETGAGSQAKNDSGKAKGEGKGKAGGSKSHAPEGDSANKT
jgi:opacity protein-like surface antigen